MTLKQRMANEKHAIYCAGKVAREIIGYATKNGVFAEVVLVTNKQGNPSNICGIPVCEVSKFENQLQDYLVVVCAMENIHEEIQNELNKYKCKEVIYCSNELFAKVEKCKNNKDMDIINRLSEIQNFHRFIPKPCLEYLVVNILDHCNLRCKGCDHFACIADEYFVSPQIIHNDLDRLAEIFHGDYIMKIAIMGGEPLLHPNLLDIIKDVRSHFPHTMIRLTTNGLLLLKQSQEFWKVCRENSVTIVNTKYPINLDFEKMKEKATIEKVDFRYFEGTGDNVVKTSFKKVVDLEGQNNPVKSFAKCHISNYGNFLMEGKLYGCPFSCQSYRIFNHKFNQNLHMTEMDYLDIYKVKDMKEIFEFAARPKYYCRYCNGKVNGFKWERSKGTIDEWVDL